jgi:hypothetical protein
MPEVTELRKGLQFAKKGEVNFAFTFGSGGENLMVQKRTIKTGAIKESRQQTGGQAIMGSCQFVDGELVVKIAKGRCSASTPKKIRKLIKAQTRMSWKIRIQEEGEEAEEEQEAEE